MSASCWTVSRTSPFELLVLHVDGYLPSATTMSPPSLRGPLLHVSGLVAQAEYPADAVDCEPPFDLLVPQAATPSRPTAERATRPVSLFVPTRMSPPDLLPRAANWNTPTAWNG